MPGLGCREKMLVADSILNEQPPSCTPPPCPVQDTQHLPTPPPPLTPTNNYYKVSTILQHVY